MGNTLIDRWFDLTMTIFYLILPAVGLLTGLALAALLLWPSWKRKWSIPEIIPEIISSQQTRTAVKLMDGRWMSEAGNFHHTQKEAEADTMAALFERANG